MALTKISRGLLNTGVSDSSDSTFLTVDSSENATLAGNLTVSGNLTVTGTSTTVDTVTMNAQNAVIFEGATADNYETTLSIVDPTADHTQYLINQDGYIPVLAAVSTTAITSTPAELNLIDGGTARGTDALASGDGILINDAGTMKMTDVDTVKTFMGTTTEEIQDIVGAMFTSNTETGIAATYEDGDGTIDLVVGTLNQNTTGTAATVTGAAQTAITSLGTLTALTVDDITLNGSTLSTPSSLTLDLGGNLTINVDGTVVSLSDDTVNFGQFFNTGAGAFNIYSPTSNQDMVFRGNDGGSGIIALNLDMSAAGKATFNAGVDAAPNADTVSVFGRTAIGFVSGLSDYAMVSHYDRQSSSNYALLQSASGSTYLNGTDVNLSIDGTRKVTLDSSGRMIIGHTASISGVQNMKLQVYSDTYDGSVSLGRWTDNNLGQYVNFIKSRHGTVGSHAIVQDDDVLGSIVWNADDGASFGGRSAEIRAEVDGTPGTNDVPGRLTFHTTADGTNGVSERMRITSAGNVGIGDTSPDELLHITAASGDANIRMEGDAVRIKKSGSDWLSYDGSNLKLSTANNERMRITSDGKIFIGDNSFGGTAAKFAVEVPASGAGCLIKVDSTANANETMLQFQDGAGQGQGSITSNPNANTTNYGTSSDYRLKENVVDMTNATTRLKQLKPKRFNWKKQESGTLYDGFLAHEVSAIVPEAIVGTKDAKDSDDNPIYQQIDNSKLVPLLVKTIQELEEKLNIREGELEQRVHEIEQRLI